MFQRALIFPVCSLIRQVFKPRTPPEAIALCSRLLEYTPVTRLSPLEACAHAFFDELRQPNTRLPSGRELPLLFNFSPVGQFSSFPASRLWSEVAYWLSGRWWCWHWRSLVPHSLSELSIQPQLNSTLIPPHARAQTSPASHGWYHTMELMVMLSLCFLLPIYKQVFVLFPRQREVCQTVPPSPAQYLDLSATALEHRPLSHIFFFFFFCLPHFCPNPSHFLLAPTP